MRVGVLVGLMVSVFEGVAVGGGLDVAVAVAVSVDAGAGLGVKVDVGVGVGVSVGSTTAVGAGAGPQEARGIRQRQSMILSIADSFLILLPLCSSVYRVTVLLNTEQPREIHPRRHCSL